DRPQRGQGFRGDRRRHPQFHALYPLREDAGPVFEHDEEPVRLHRQVDQRPVLTTEFAMPPLSRGLAAALLALGLILQPASAQSHPEFVNCQGRTKGALYKPDAGPAPHVGIVVMHRTSNYLAHRACTELSRRGFLMLCMNTRYENNEPAVDFEKLPLDVKAGVE